MSIGDHEHSWFIETTYEDRDEVATCLTCGAQRLSTRGSTHA